VQGFCYERARHRGSTVADMKTLAVSPDSGPMRWSAVGWWLIYESNDNP